MPVVAYLTWKNVIHPPPGHWPPFLGVLLATSVFAAAVGVLLGAAVRRATTVALAGVTVASYLFFLGGGFTTIAFLPAWLQTLSRAVPTRYGIDGMRQALFYPDLIGVRPTCSPSPGFALGRARGGDRRPRPERPVRLWVAAAVAGRGAGGPRDVTALSSTNGAPRGRVLASPLAGGGAPPAAGASRACPGGGGRPGLGAPLPACAAASSAAFGCVNEGENDALSASAPAAGKAATSSSRSWSRTSPGPATTTRTTSPQLIVSAATVPRWSAAARGSSSRLARRRSTGSTRPCSCPSPARRRRA